MDHIFKPKNTKIDTELPKLVKALDYHDFDLWNIVVNKINKKLVVEEVGCKDGWYYGLIFIKDSIEHIEILRNIKKEFS